jgi:hypothetical protein
MPVLLYKGKTIINKNMNETQARSVRTLRIDQNCSYQTVARKFYEEYGSTKYCKEPTGALYSNMDVNPLNVTQHIYADGDIPCDNYRIVENLFSRDSGFALCEAARTHFREDPGGGWSDNVVYSIADRELER